MPKKLCNTSKILDNEAKNCSKVRKIVEISKKCAEKKENQGQKYITHKINYY